MLKLVQFKRNPALDSGTRDGVFEVYANYKLIGTIFKQTCLAESSLSSRDKQPETYYPDQRIAKIVESDKPLIGDFALIKHIFRMEITEKFTEWEKIEEPKVI